MKYLIFLILLITIQSYGQKCDIVKNETDKFTGHRVIHTGHQTLVPGFRFNTKRIDQFTYLELFVGSLVVFSVDKGSDILLLFEDGSKLTLKNMEYVIADPIQAPGITTWIAQLTLFIDQEAISLLNNPVTAIRVYGSDGYMEGEVKPKNRFKIRDAIQCISSIQ